MKNSKYIFLYIAIIGVFLGASFFVVNTSDVYASHVDGGGLGQSCSSDSWCHTGYCSSATGCSYPPAYCGGALTVGGTSYCQASYECCESSSCSVSSGNTYGSCKAINTPSPPPPPCNPVRIGVTDITRNYSQATSPRVEVSWAPPTCDPRFPASSYSVYRCEGEGCSDLRLSSESFSLPGYVLIANSGRLGGAQFFPTETTYHDYTRINYTSRVSPLNVVSWGKTYKYAVISYNPSRSRVSNVSSVTFRTECANGRDDDGDALIDLADPGCTNASDNTEAEPGSLSSPGSSLSNLQCSVTDTSISLGESVTYSAAAQNGAEPYIFDWSGDSDVESATQTLYFDTFESGFGNWVNGVGDQMDWTRVQTGFRHSSGTGPTRDHTTGSGYYVYTEASGSSRCRTNCGDYNKITYLGGPVINFDAYENEQITFWYHMRGENMGSMFLEVSNPGGGWTVLWSKWGDQGYSWRKATVDLSQLSGSNILRFTGLTGPSFTSDMALDDISITAQAGSSVAAHVPDSSFALDESELIAKNAQPFIDIFKSLLYKIPFASEEVLSPKISEAEASHTPEGGFCRRDSDCTSGNCSGFTRRCVGGTPVACGDGVDNDGDGLIDYPNDHGCSSSSDTDESDDPQCADGIDNDTDGRIDTWDNGCVDFSDNSEDSDPPRPNPSTFFSVTYSTPGSKAIDVALTDGAESNLVSACPLVTVAAPPLSTRLQANPTSGISPLQVVLTAQIRSGAWAPTTNYSFWRHCWYSDSTPSFDEARAQCGDPTDPNIGAKFDNQPSTSYTASFTYTNTSQDPVTVRPIVIIEHGSNTSHSAISPTITINPQLPDLSCTPSSLTATPGALRTFNASGGDGNFNWSVSPAANCNPTSGSNSNLTVSCDTEGIREITVDDNDATTAPGTCLLKVVRPGIIEI